jgi:hypothetical protein
LKTDKPSYTKTQNINARSRSKARNLAGRICKHGPDLYIVKNKPDPAKLFECLKKMLKSPGFDNDPTPHDLGFSGSDIIPVDQKEINEWNSGLIRWQKTLTQITSKRHVKKTDRIKAKTWQSEILSLEKRKMLLFTILDNLKTDKTSVQRFPAYAEKTALNMTQNNIAPDPPIPSKWSRLADICGWIGDDKSVERLIKVMASVCLTKNEHESLFRLRDALKRHAVTLGVKPGKRSNAPHVWEAIHSSICDTMNQIPADVLEKAELKFPPKSKRRLMNYLEPTITALDNRLSGSDLRRYDNKIAFIAVIASLDSGTAPLPELLLHVNYESPEVILADFVKASQHLHYNDLLSTLSVYFTVYQKKMQDIEHINWFDSDVFELLNILDTGATPEDTAWLIAYGYSMDIKLFVEHALSPGSLRAIIRHLGQHGMTLSEAATRSAIEHSAHAENTYFADQFANWLVKIPRRYWNEEKANTAWNIFISSLSLSIFESAFRAHLHSWVHPSEKGKTIQLPKQLSASVRHQIKQMLFYKNLSGKGDNLPPALFRLLWPEAQYEKELLGLEKLESEGKLHSEKQKRLQVLRLRDNHGIQPELNETKIVRKTEELTAIFALEALAGIVKEISSECFTKNFGCIRPPWISFQEIAVILSWRKKLDQASRARFEEILSAWSSREAMYKEELAANSAWIKNATEHGIDINMWLNPPAQECILGKKKIIIRYAEDPFRTLFMGTYFDTCLSIHNVNDFVANTESLVNAYDANKQVVFAFDEKGGVLGRKLIAISNRWHLIGYRVYVSDNTEKTLLTDRINQFCIDLAERIHLQTKASGKPDNLSELDWYDDGVCDFHDSTESDPPNRAKRNDQNRGYTSDAVLVDREIRKLVFDHRSELVSLLDRIGLWHPVEGSDACEELLKCQALAEEALAFLAREKKDAKLAAAIHSCALTESGRIEAFLADLDMNRSNIKNLGHYYGTKQTRLDVMLPTIDTIESAQNLTQMSLQNSTHLNFYSLLSLLYRSRTAATYLKEFLLREKRWILEGTDLCLFLHFVMHHTHSLSDALIHRLFVNYPTDNRGSTYISLRLDNVQSLPVYKNPGKILSEDILLAVYNDATIKDVWEQFIDVNKVAVIIWAMRNPCNASIKFLRRLSESDPRALLALSLVRPGRFQTFLLTQAASMFPSRAAILALITILGCDEARKFAAERKHDIEESAGKLLDEMCFFYKKVSTFSWDEIGKSESKARALDILPFLVHMIHRALAVQIDGNFSCGSNGALANIFSGVNVFHVLTVLARRLSGTDHEDETLRLLRAIHSILHLSDIKHFPYDVLLWLNLISNDRIFTKLDKLFPAFNRHFLNRVNINMKYGSNQVYNPYELFFREDGTPRNIAAIPWSGMDFFSDLPNILPDDLEQARIYADFLVSKLPENFADKIEAGTVIHKRLYEATFRRKKGETTKC